MLAEEILEILTLGLLEDTALVARVVGFAVEEGATEVLRALLTGTGGLEAEGATLDELPVVPSEVKTERELIVQYASAKAVGLFWT